MTPGSVLNITPERRSLRLEDAHASCVRNARLVEAGFMFSVVSLPSIDFFALYRGALRKRGSLWPRAALPGCRDCWWVLEIRFGAEDVFAAFLTGSPGSDRRGADTKKFPDDSPGISLQEKLSRSRSGPATAYPQDRAERADSEDQGVGGRLGNDESAFRDGDVIVVSGPGIVAERLHNK